MKIQVIVEIPADELRNVEALCVGLATDCGRDETVYEKEAIFSDGMVMLVQAIASSEPNEGCWTQGVLFQPSGGLLNEVGCTDVGDTFAGEYVVEHNGTEYEALVKALPEGGK